MKIRSSSLRFANQWLSLAGMDCGNCRAGMASWWKRYYSSHRYRYMEWKIITMECKAGIYTVVGHMVGLLVVDWKFMRFISNLIDHMFLKTHVSMTISHSQFWAPFAQQNGKYSSGRPFAQSGALWVVVVTVVLKKSPLKDTEIEIMDCLRWSISHTSVVAVVVAWWAHPPDHAGTARHAVE